MEAFQKKVHECLLDRADVFRIDTNRKLDSGSRASLGQFMTPAREGSRDRTFRSTEKASDLGPFGFDLFWYNKQTIDVGLEETRTEAGLPPLVTSRILRYDRFHHLVVRANRGVDILSR